MPKDSEGSTGSSYIVDKENRKVLIPIDVNKIGDIKELLGTVTEEVAHGKDALEGRQDKKVAEDKSNDEEGLESLGRPANEYVKKRFGEDNNSKIKLTTDGIDLSNADVGEKVGDSKGIAKIKGLAMGPNETLKFLSMNKKIIENMNETPTVYNYINGEAMVKIFEGQENVINKILIEENYDISSEKVHKELRKIAEIGGTGYTSSPYEGLYVIDNPDLRKKFIDKNNNLHLELFDPPGWNKIEKSEIYKNGVENLKKKAQEKYEKNKDIINKKPDNSSNSKKNKYDKALGEMEKVRNFMVSLATPRNDENDIYEINEIVSFETPPRDEKDIYKVSEDIKFASLSEGKTKNNLEYALGNSKLVGTIFMKDGKPYLRYNLSDSFQDVTGSKSKIGVEIEYGKPYDMLGPSKEIPLFDEKGMKK